MSDDKDGLDGLGDKLKDFLSSKGVLPPGVSVEDVHVIERPASGKRRYPRPALLADLRGLLVGAVQKKFELGDIVVLRAWAEPHMKFPKIGERCIVTQVLDAPYRGGEAGTCLPGIPHDIALAFIDPDGDVFEYLYDSRMFEKVGSIYDPVTTTDGEVLPTA